MKVGRWFLITVENLENQSTMIPDQAYDQTSDPSVSQEGQ